MEIQRKSAQALRQRISHDIKHKEQSILDRLSEKVGKQNLAYMLMICASLIYPSGFLYSNQNHLNIFQTCLIRGIAMIIINISIARYFSIDITYQSPHNLRVLFVRNLIMTIQGITYTIVQFYLTQPIIQTLSSTGPLFIFIMDYKINGVEITRKQFFGVVLGTIGVLLTVNGQLLVGILIGDYQIESEFQYKKGSVWVKMFFAALFVFAQMAWAYGQVITKTLQGVNSIQINVHLAYVIILSTGLIYPNQVVQPVAFQKIVMAIFLGGFPMAIGSILFIGAVTMTKNTGSLTMVSLISVILGYVVSVMRYNQKINPICSLGTLLIVLGLTKIVFKDKPIQTQIHSISIEKK